MNKIINIPNDFTKISKTKGTKIQYETDQNYKILTFSVTDLSE